MKTLKDAELTSLIQQLRERQYVAIENKNLNYRAPSTQRSKVSLPETRYLLVSQSMTAARVDQPFIHRALKDRIWPGKGLTRCNAPEDLIPTIYKSRPQPKGVFPRSFTRTTMLCVLRTVAFRCSSIRASVLMHHRFGSRRTPASITAAITTPS